MSEPPERIYAIRDADGEPDWSTFEMEAEERERLELFGGWEAPYVLASEAERLERQRDKLLEAATAALEIGFGERDYDNSVNTKLRRAIAEAGEAS